MREVELENCPFCGSNKVVKVKEEDGSEEYIVPKEAAINAAKVMQAFCKTQHWECRRCPFYELDRGHCKVYGFPHTWESWRWGNTNERREPD